MLGTCSGLELPVFKLLFSSVCHSLLSVSWQRASTARLPPSSSFSVRADSRELLRILGKEKAMSTNRCLYPVVLGMGEEWIGSLRIIIFLIFIDLHLCNQLGSS